MLCDTGAFANCISLKFYNKLLPRMTSHALHVFARHCYVRTPQPQLHSALIHRANGYHIINKAVVKKSS